MHYALCKGLCFGLSIAARYICARKLMMRVRKLVGITEASTSLLSIERSSLLIRAINRDGSLNSSESRDSQCDSESLRRIAPCYYPRQPNAAMENLPVCLWPSSRSSNRHLSRLADATECVCIQAIVTVHHLNVTRSRLHPSFLVYTAAKLRSYTSPSH